MLLRKESPPGIRKRMLLDEIRHGKHCIPKNMPGKERTGPGFSPVLHLCLKSPKSGMIFLHTTQHDVKI